MKEGLRLEFDKSIRDFQAALTLISDTSMIEKSLDRVWNKYCDSVPSQIKLFVCLMAHSKLGNHFRDLPCFRSISYLTKKEIPTTLLLHYFSYPWKNPDLGVIFFCLPTQVSWEYLQLLLTQSSPIHPILFRSLRRKDCPSSNSNDSTVLRSILGEYSRNELIELIFFLTVNFDDALLFNFKEFGPELAPVQNDFEKVGELNQFIIHLLNLCNDVWDNICSNTDRDNFLSLFWPFEDILKPESDQLIIQHYAHCILQSQCDESLKNRLSPLAKEYHQHNNMSFEDLLASSGESEWTYLWELVFEKNTFLEDLSKMRESKNLKLNCWTLKPLFSKLLIHATSLDLKYLISETFKILPLADKVNFLKEYLDNIKPDTNYLRNDGFLEEVKTFLNKAGDYDIISAQHDALNLALFSPREFLNILLKEVFSCGHKVYLKVLVESLHTLLYRDEQVLRETLINALLDCSDENFPENLASTKVIVENNRLNDFEHNLVNTAFNLFSTNRFVGALRLIISLNHLGQFLNVQNDSDVFQTLVIMYKVILDHSSLSSETARLQETILEVVRNYGSKKLICGILDEWDSNKLHKILRRCYLSKIEEEEISFSSEGNLLDYLVPTISHITPSEWRILCQKITFYEDKVKSIFKALSIVALEGNYDLYVFRQASLEITGLANQHKSDCNFLLNLLNCFSKFIWITKRRSDIVPIFDICLTSLIGIILDNCKDKDKENIKTILLHLNFVPNCSSKNIVFKKIEQLIACHSL